MARTTMYTQFIALPVELVWGVLGDPTRWPEWNAGVTSVRLQGPVAVGTTGDYLPRGRVYEAVHGRTAPPFVISTLVPGRELSIEQPEPVGRMRLTWTLTPRNGGTEVTQALTFSGPSASIARMAVGSLLEHDARVCFARLAQLAGIEPAERALTVVIAGGTGALGKHIAADLTCRGHRVNILTRRRDPGLPFDQLEWDGRSVGKWVAALRNPGPTAIVNLAGNWSTAAPANAMSTNCGAAESIPPAHWSTLPQPSTVPSITGCRPAPRRSGRTRAKPVARKQLRYRWACRR
ncbi:SRPBCC family protein [Nocardia sp. NPDC057030]|uniref:SRPBCC family protein n=1 Tax=unclassified Nocardia TaxID=2637762 RepID=UPI0036282D3E